MTRAGRIRALLVICALVLLEILCRVRLISPESVVPPSAMVQGAVAALSTRDIRDNVLLTLGTVLQSLALSLVAGVLLGALLHRLPRLRRAVDPLLAGYYAVPTFVFYPVFIVIFGLNRWPLVAIGFVIAVVAVIVNTLDGFARLPRAYARTAQAMRLTPFQRARYVTLPAIAPWLFTGAKFAVAYSFIGVIAGEFVLAGAGIGHDIAFAYNAFDNRTMYGLILVLFAIVGAVNAFFSSWEYRLHERRGGR